MVSQSTGHTLVDKVLQNILKSFFNMMFDLKDMAAYVGCKSLISIIDLRQLKVRMVCKYAYYTVEYMYTWHNLYCCVI